MHSNKMKRGETVAVGVRLYTDLRDKVYADARAGDRSFAAQLNRIIRESYAKNPTTTTKSRRRDGSIEAAE